MSDPTDMITPQCEALGSRIAASLGEFLGIPYEDGKERFTAERTRRGEGRAA